MRNLKELIKLINFWDLNSLSKGIVAFVIFIVSLVSGVIGYSLNNNDSYFSEDNLQNTIQVVDVKTTLEPTSTPEALVSPTPVMDKLQDTEIVDCFFNSKDCLFKTNNKVVGLAHVVGYYEKYDGTQWEWGQQQAECEGFVTIGGSEELVDEFKQSAENGNTLNKFIDGKFYLNVNTGLLDENTKQLLYSTNENKHVELVIVRRQSPGRATSTCASKFEILDVREI